jgi:hypothetical protein
MTPNLQIAQALIVADARGVRVVAESDGFDAPEGERVAVLFGKRPPGVSCPLAHFACPFGSRHVAVVQVADRPGPNDPLAFRFLVLDRELYRHLGDPFAIADRYPPPWGASGTLPVLEWPHEVLPRRTVEQVQAVLKEGDRPPGTDEDHPGVAIPPRDNSLFLGGAQALVDGSRVVVRRPAPDEKLVRGLWQLLPDRTRSDLWPASFAFSLELGFHFAAMPEVPPLDLNQFHDEERARDYPQGGYELSLQIAAEHGDQGELDRLFARRTSAETLRLGLYILGGALLIAAVFKFVLP